MTHCLQNRRIIWNPYWIALEMSSIISFAIFYSLFYRSLALLIFILATYFSTVLARRVSKLNELPVIFSSVAIEGARILQQFV
jgi:hypothetical protein